VPMPPKGAPNDVGKPPLMHSVWCPWCPTAAAEPGLPELLAPPAAPAPQAATTVPTAPASSALRRLRRGSVAGAAPPPAASASAASSGTGCGCSCATEGSFLASSSASRFRSARSAFCCFLDFTVWKSAMASSPSSTSPLGSTLTTPAPKDNPKSPTGRNTAVDVGGGGRGRSTCGGLSACCCCCCCCCSLVGAGAVEEVPTADVDLPTLLAALRCGAASRGRAVKSMVGGEVLTGRMPGPRLLEAARAGGRGATATVGGGEVRSSRRRCGPQALGRSAGGGREVAAGVDATAGVAAVAGFSFLVSVSGAGSSRFECRSPCSHACLLHPPLSLQRPAEDRSLLPRCRPCQRLPSCASQDHSCFDASWVFSDVTASPSLSLCTPVLSFTTQRALRPLPSLRASLPFPRSRLPLLPPFPLPFFS